MHEPRRALRVLAFPCAVALVAVGAAAAVPAAGGCQTHQCDADCVTLGAAPTPDCAEGDMADLGHAILNGNEITWESSSNTQPWLDFPGQRTYRLNWAKTVRDQLGIDTSTLSPDAVIEVDSYISTDDAQPTTSFVNGAGQLAEYFCLDASHVCVFNAECAEYFLRVVVRIELGPKEHGDAGIDGAD